MENEKTKISIHADINVPIEKAWKLWTTPEDITQWNNASDDWHTTKAENDLKVGGKFSSRMEAKDGSMGFDFWGTYDEIILYKIIAYTMGDGRTCRIEFTSNNNNTSITSVFEAENQNSVEMQQAGWQSILNSFKKYAESK